MTSKEQTPPAPARDDRLQGKVAMITGASRGLGRGIAVRYARSGARCVLTARDEAALAETARAVREAGGEARVVPGEVTDERAMAAVAEEAVGAWGALDILVNSAGAFHHAPFMEHNLADWTRLWDVNVLGTVVPIRAALAHMLPRGSGRIVNVASTAGKYGSMNQAAYNATKHAVVGLTRSLALEVAKRGIRVNAICPNVVQTEMFTGHREAYMRTLGLDDPEAVLPALLQRIPIGRTVTPEEVAGLAVYLAAPESDAMTGQALTLSGGFLLV